MAIYSAGAKDESNETGMPAYVKNGHFPVLNNLCGHAGIDSIYL